MLLLKNIIQNSKNFKSSLPLVGLKWAQTLDGQMADDLNNSKWISGKEELCFTHELRGNYDAILVGITTFIKDLSKLTVRHVPLVKNSKQPIRVIFDPRNRMQNFVSDKKVIKELSDTLRPTILLSTNKLCDPRLPAQVSNLDVSSSLTRTLGLDILKNFCHSILERDLNSLMIEGGPATINMFLEKNLVDMAHVSIAPILTGGCKNRITSNRCLIDAHRFDVMQSYQKGQDTILEMLHPKHRTNQVEQKTL